MKTAAILLDAAVTGGDVPAPPPVMHTQEEMQSAIVTAMEFGRQLGIAEASAAIEEARRAIERCALARPI